MSLNPPGEETDCRVFDVQRFSIHDGPGIRTTVFLEGCPLRCAWCQNPEGLQNGRAPVKTASAVIHEVLKDRDYYTVSGGGMTVSGGEPLLHVTQVRALLEEAKRHGLHTCVQTSGAVPQANLEAVLELVDLFQFDLKHMDPQRHRELTGAGNERIHQNAAFLVARGANVQFRVPVIPGLNDDAEHVDRVARFVAGLGAATLRLVPYHGLYVQKYETLGLRPGVHGIQPPSETALRDVATRIRRHGLSVEVDA